MPRKTDPAPDTLVEKPIVAPIEKPVAKPVEVAVEKPLQAYSFPTVGNGVTVFAASQEEANEKAAKIKADHDAARS